jgi:hypothetical protein
MKRVWSLAAALVFAALCGRRAEAAGDYTVGLWLDAFWPALVVWIGVGWAIGTLTGSMLSALTILAIYIGLTAVSVALTRFFSPSVFGNFPIGNAVICGVFFAPALLGALSSRYGAKQVEKRQS